MTLLVLIGILFAWLRFTDPPTRQETRRTEPDPAFYPSGASSSRA